ncbi:hypothetical protein [Streptomyces lydicus]|uniref:hypothetical protein n=1 Tax=Streptomyces lydicus TaxID=47763 RepID=UPI0038081D71
MLVEPAHQLLTKGTPMQTCRRHPEAGHFMATCPGCAQELYDIEQRNIAKTNALHTQARQALNLVGTTPDAEIISVHRDGEALIVATQQPGAFHTFAVDTFRLPTAEEIDPDQVDPLTAGAWLLIDSRGGYGSDELPGMVASAKDHLRTVPELNAQPEKQSTEMTINDLRHLASPVTAAAFPATKALAYSYLDVAEAAWSKHLAGCWKCRSIGELCAEGGRISQILDQVATCAVDWDELNDCLRGGDRELYLCG